MTFNEMKEEQKKGYVNYLKKNTFRILKGAFSNLAEEFLPAVRFFSYVLFIITYPVLFPFWMFFGFLERGNRIKEEEKWHNRLNGVLPKDDTSVEELKDKDIQE